MATVVLIVCVVAAALLLGRVAEDGVFATILILVFGLVWAHTLYTDRKHEREDRAESKKARESKTAD